MNMLYGGPLGTYLSGLSSTSSSPSSSSTNATSYLNSSSSVYNSPSNSTNYYSGISGLRRSSSRYRNSTSGNNLSTTSTSLNTTNSSNISNNNSNSNTVSGTNPYSSYYTPPVRRKYGTPETDTPKPSRYLTRTQGLSSNSGSGIVSVGVGSSCSVTGTSTSSYSGLPQYPRRSPNKIGSNTNYTVGGIGTSSSWNSDLSSAASKTPNYKQLYEEEKLLTNGLREEVKAAQKELKELEDALENSVGRRRPSEVEQRKMERRISECEQELKLIEKLRAESEKLHAEHRALIRVVSRLNREQ
ncbi:hypothetical protein MS3_00002719 [Schistosoma haematobium]|uniref:cGMP-dependent protein kinase interacting domain-containing protein n=2 Tax=Schistosoma TaxID=6181 RepID=A0A922LMD6_SCHHA|nr:hypothetical protein MS3_00002719 [Schistosoma haematobium]KAH9589781.1 hypothetical protein MS3_00002719 [Schistosoma haematobium]